jgi:hypothetical protein
LLGIQLLFVRFSGLWDGCAFFSQFQIQRNEAFAQRFGVVAVRYNLTNQKVVGYWENVLRLKS